LIKNEIIHKLYFIGYSIPQQMQLFSSIKPLFKNKPLVIVLNKTDIKPYIDLNQEDKTLIEGIAKENNTYLIQMSNISGDGVSDVKSSACDILTEFRFANKKKTERAIGDNVLDKIYVAQPSQTRGERNRKPNIPESVIQERQQEVIEENNRLNNMNEEERIKMEEKRLRDGDVEKLERKIKHNRVKELIEANGGIGVFSISDRGNIFQ
jgi:nucleolar GTP-binding protein